MTYTKMFDAEQLEAKRGSAPQSVSYYYHGDLELAINVALAARRPLLLTGLPGTGKSSIAKDIAWKLGCRYYDEVITSRTQARDLQWSVDTVRRLSDATHGGVNADAANYLQAGVLWHAFSPETVPPASRQQRGWMDDAKNGAVVLLDEIDKAEPDMPNDLLVTIDASRFVVSDTKQTVRKPEPAPESNDSHYLIVITSNGERALPPAFLRRCIPYEIEQLKQLDEVIARHFKVDPKPEPDLIAAAQKLFVDLNSAARVGRLRLPSTAELLDALFACTRLGITSATDPKWLQVAERALWKSNQPVPTASPTAGNS